MLANTIKIYTPIDIKSTFYQDVAKDIKKILKSSYFDFTSATVKDEYADNGNIVVTICIGELIKFGCDDGLPWIEAFNAAKLFEKMASIGFKSLIFKVTPCKSIYKKNKRENEEKAQALEIGFIKAIPKKQIIKNV